MALRFMLLLLLLAGRPAFANMGSPYISGTRSATAFSSRNLDILSETLHLRIDAAYSSAKFTVEYTVQSDIAGTQIPLLFLAVGYADSFRVWVDGQPVALQPIPAQYTQFAASPFSAFTSAKSGESRSEQDDEVRISWDKTYSSVYKLHDLKYFETNLSKGVHKIRVVYKANPWLNRAEWVQASEFRYSLSPAQYWRSFGSLQITVVQEGTPKPLQIQFGGSAEKWTGSTKTWNFRKLPAEFISVFYTPEVSKAAAFFIALEPFGMVLILGVLFLALHLGAIRAYRKAHLQKKYSPVVIVGSLLLPFVWLAAYVTFHYFIDWLLGPVASGWHGYVFMVIVLYPVVMAFYWIAMWAADRYFKYSFNRDAAV